MSGKEISPGGGEEQFRRFAPEVAPEIRNLLANARDALDMHIRAQRQQGEDVGVLDVMIREGYDGPLQHLDFQRASFPRDLRLRVIRDEDHNVSGLEVSGNARLERLTTIRSRHEVFGILSVTATNEEMQRIMGHGFDAVRSWTPKDLTEKISKRR